jgi:hypothetical protein
MIETVGELSFWQLIIGVINILVFIYIITYTISKAFFKGYYTCKKNHILELKDIVNVIKDDIDKTIPIINNQIRNGDSDVGLEDSKESIHK